MTTARALAAGALLGIAAAVAAVEPPATPPDPSASNGSATSPAPPATPSPAPPPAGPATPATIQWMDWSEKAFLRAAAEGKPILLNVRALWSRSSLWSEEVNFGDPEVVKVVNERWIPIRVD